MKPNRKAAMTAAALRQRFALLLLALVGITSAQVWAAQNDGSDQELVPRTLERLDVGYQLPIEIVSVKNLQKRRHWVRDLELEITNISANPIYEVFFNLFLPDVKNDRGASFAMFIEYGRSELLDLNQHSTVDDKPIGPGETVILKVDKRQSPGHETYLAGNAPEEATYNVRMLVVGINFGNGTGFMNGGVPYPRDRTIGPRPQRYVRVGDSSR